MKFTHTIHDVYGEVKAPTDMLNTDSPMVPVIVKAKNRRDVVKPFDVLLVSKGSLKDQGGYKRLRTIDQNLVEQNLWVASTAASAAYRIHNDRFEWQELYAEACVHLCLLATTYNQGHESGAMFATYAKEPVKGHLKNFTSRTRTKSKEMEANTFHMEDDFDFFETDGDQLWDDQQIETMHAAVAAMAPVHKQVIRKKYLEGKSQTAIASELDISQSSVSRIELEALGRIKAYMEHRDQGLQ